MKNIIKVSKFIGMCLIVSLLLTPVEAEATSNKVPTWTLDWVQESWLGGQYNEALFWTNGVEYSNFQYEPYNGSLKLKIDNRDLTGTNMIVTCYNSSGTQVGVRAMSPRVVQILSFDNLSQYDTYYFKFTGTSINGYGTIYTSQYNTF